MMCFFGISGFLGNDVRNQHIYTCSYSHYTYYSSDSSIPSSLSWEARWSLSGGVLWRTFVVAHILYGWYIWEVDTKIFAFLLLLLLLLALHLFWFLMGEIITSSSEQKALGAAQFLIWLALLFQVPLFFKLGYRAHCGYCLRIFLARHRREGNM